MSAMSLDGPSYYGCMPDPPPSTTAPSPATPNVPQGHNDLHNNEDITPPSSPPLTPQGLRSFSDFDMPGGWRKSFGAAAAPHQSGPRSGGGVPLQGEETLAAEDLGTPFRRPAANHQQPQAYKRQHANQRPCRSGLFAGGNHVPRPGATAPAAQAQANFFGFPPCNDFMPTPPSSHPNSDNEAEIEEHIEDDEMETDLRWKAARASAKSHRAAASFRKARADIRRYIDQRDADTQRARDIKRREAERRKRNETKPLKEQQAAWWNSHSGGSSPFQPRPQQHAPKNPSSADTQRQHREMEDRERQRKVEQERQRVAAHQQEMRAKQEQLRAAREAERLRLLRKQELQERLRREAEERAAAAREAERIRFLREQELQERLRRQAEEQAAAAREAERIHLLRQHELQERLRREAEERAAAAREAERIRLLREQEEEQIRQQAAWAEQQRRLYEEQQRKLHEQQERERQQREYADANWRRILQDQCQLAMNKMRTDATYLHECRESYDNTWAELTRPIPSPGCPQFINIVYFPWPCSITFALDVTRIETLPFVITRESVAEFLNRGVSDASEIKRRLRKASARFHPDKIGRIYPRLRDEDREFIMTGFELVQIQLNLLMEQLR